MEDFSLLNKDTPKSPNFFFLQNFYSRPTQSPLLNIQLTANSHLRTTYAVHKKPKNFIEYMSTAPKMDHVYKDHEIGRQRRAPFCDDIKLITIT